MHDVMFSHVSQIQIQAVGELFTVARQVAPWAKSAILELPCLALRRFAALDPARMRLQPIRSVQPSFFIPPKFVATAVQTECHL